MFSIENAHGLRVNSEVALLESRQAREHYIQGLRMKVGDEELRHLHQDAMHAHRLADKAASACFGERKVIFHA